MLVGSCIAERRPSPLGDLTDITRLEVSSRGQRRHVFTRPADSLRITMVAEAVRTHHGPWKRTWHTLPAGDLTVSFFRDTTHLGILWLGSEFLVASGSGETLLTAISRTDEIHLRALLNPVTVLGTIGNETPKPPQN
jgi:hypothetical protein